MPRAGSAANPDFTGLMFACGGWIGSIQYARAAGVRLSPASLLLRHHDTAGGRWLRQGDLRRPASPAGFLRRAVRDENAWMAGDPVARNPIAGWAADDAGRARPPDVAVFRSRAMNAGGTFFAVIGFSTILGALISLPGTDAAGHVILPLVGSVLAIAE
jgi:hypothetical protein